MRIGIIAIFSVLSFLALLDIRDELKTLTSNVHIIMQVK